MIRSLLLAALFLLAAAPAFAVEPSERLANPALEARAEAIGSELRCLVCQNESIEESSADLAHDLRVIIRKRLVAGDTDQEAINFVVARYGLFVLLDPPFIPATYALWLTPPALVLGGAAVLLLRARRRRVGAGPAALTPEEHARADMLLGRSQ
jgi:cytochrome c-type biogenesis protein CcmH